MAILGVGGMLLACGASWNLPPNPCQCHLTYGETKEESGLFTGTKQTQNAAALPPLDWEGIAARAAAGSSGTQGLSGPARWIQSLGLSGILGWNKPPVPSQLEAPLASSGLSSSPAPTLGERVVGFEFSWLSCSLQENHR